MVSVHSEKPIICIYPVSQMFPKVTFEMVSMFVGLTVALSHPFKDHLVLPLSTPLSSSQGARDGGGGAAVSAPAREQEIESKTETDCRTIAVFSHFRGGHYTD